VQNSKSFRVGIQLLWIGVEEEIRGRIGCVSGIGGKDSRGGMGGGKEQNPKIRFCIFF